MAPKAKAEKEPKEVDLTAYVEKSATPLQQREPDWIMDNTGYDPASAKTKEDAFRMGVKLCLNVHKFFQISPENREATEAARLAKAEEAELKAAERAEKAEEREAKEAERAEAREARDAKKAEKAAAKSDRPAKAPAKGAAAKVPAKKVIAKKVAAKRAAAGKTGSKSLF